MAPVECLECHGLNSAQALSHIDELIYLPAVNRLAETLAPVEEDKEFDRKESPVRLLDRSRLSKFSSTLNESF